MNATANTDRLIWIDLEMTGLDTDNDSIIEIATVVTDGQLNVLAEGPEYAIAHPLERLQAMDEWNRGQPRRSGLWDRVIASQITLAQAEALEAWCIGKTVEEVVSMPTYDKGDGHHTQVPDDVDLKSGCTIDAGSFLQALQKAADNAK